jgi:hypothetical protein
MKSGVLQKNVLACPPIYVISLMNPRVPQNAVLDRMEKITKILNHVNRHYPAMKPEALLDSPDVVH